MIVISIVICGVSTFWGKHVKGIICGGVVILQTVILVVSIIPIESALKNKFDSDGNIK